MPELPRFTASGNVRSGPVAAPVDASVLDRPARALVGLGAQTVGLGNDIRQIAAQRQREDDLRWVTESAAQFDRVLTERRAEDAKNPRETQGVEFRDFADQQLADYTKAAPSKRAADMFRNHGLGTVNRGYAAALQDAETTRLINADVANVKATADMVSIYQQTVALDTPEGAARDVNELVKMQLASIQTRFGQTMPALANKMTMRVVEEVAYATAPTNANYARQLVAGAPIAEEAKLIVNNKIDAIERDANATGTFNTVKLIENRIEVGYQRGIPVPMPSPAVLKGLPPNQAESIVHEVKVANGTITEFNKIRAWNWMEQQKAISAINIEGDPVAQDVRKKLEVQFRESQKQQTENPTGWQLANDPEFQRIPANESQPQRMARLQRMISLQGAPLEGTDPEQAKRYLHLPTGLHNVFSVEEARSRAQKFNNIPPNQLTQAVDQFDAEFSDPKLAAMAWNDMQNLPEGDGKLRMGIRVSTAVNDIQVRNHLLGVLSSKEVFKTEDSKAVFETQLNGNDAYRKFVSGWLGDGGQRGAELSEFNDVVMRYSMHLSAQEGLKTGKAVEKAVKRIVTDNYGTMSINGTNVPVHRFPKGRNIPYSDDDISAMSLGIENILESVTTDMISVNQFNFPLAPRLPGDQTEANNYINKLIRQTGTVVVDPDGSSASVYLKGEGVNDFPFQLRGADGLPFKWEFDAAMARGQAVLARRQADAAAVIRESRAETTTRRIEAELGMYPKPVNDPKQEAPTVFIRRESEPFRDERVQDTTIQDVIYPATMLERFKEQRVPDVVRPTLVDMINDGTIAEFLDPEKLSKKQAEELRRKLKAKRHGNE